MTKVDEIRDPSERVRRLSALLDEAKKTGDPEQRVSTVVCEEAVVFEEAVERLRELREGRRDGGAL